MDKQQEQEKLTDHDRDQTRWKETPFLILKGFLMGSADIVPGVSGGTMALILGIYERLLKAIKSGNAKAIKAILRFDIRTFFATIHWKFLLFLLTGIGCAIAFFTKVVPLQVYMHTDPELVYGIFFGLIAGSIYILAKAVSPITWKEWVMLGLGVLIGYWVVTLVPTDTPDTWWFAMLSGSVAIIAMVLPGISGSYILLILRKYDFILSQINLLGDQTSAALLILIPFGIGAIIGLALFSRVLTWLLDHYHGLTLSVLIGFLIGSLYVIWPYQQRTYQEIVTTKVLPTTDPQVVALKDNPKPKDRPKYHRLGDLIPAPPESDQPNRIEYQTVKQKLIKSTPYVPYISEISEAQSIPEQHVWYGLGGMVVGFLLVGGLERLRGE
jgi:putative membrane protein